MVLHTGWASWCDCWALSCSWWNVIDLGAVRIHSFVACKKSFSEHLINFLELFRKFYVHSFEHLPGGHFGAGVGLWQFGYTPCEPGGHTCGSSHIARTVPSGHNFVGGFGYSYPFVPSM